MPTADATKNKPLNDRLINDGKVVRPCRPYKCQFLWFRKFIAVPLQYAIFFIALELASKYAGISDRLLLNLISAVSGCYNQTLSNMSGWQVVTTHAITCSTLVIVYIRYRYDDYRDFAAVMAVRHDDTMNMQGDGQ